MGRRHGKRPRRQVRSVLSYREDALADTKFLPSRRSNASSGSLKSRKSESTRPPPSEATPSSSSHPPVLEIPGYYLDHDKKKYFKITNGNTNQGKYSTNALKTQRQVESRQSWVAKYNQKVIQFDDLEEE